VTDTHQPKQVGHPFSVTEIKKIGRSTTTPGKALDMTTMEANMAIPPLLAWIEKEAPHCMRYALTLSKGVCHPS
jgi:hypothetical protein